MPYAPVIDDLLHVHACCLWFTGRNSPASNLLARVYIVVVKIYHVFCRGGHIHLLAGI